MILYQCCKKLYWFAKLSPKLTNSTPTAQHVQLLAEITGLKNIMSLHLPLYLIFPKFSKSSWKKFICPHSFLYLKGFHLRIDERNAVVQPCLNKKPQKALKPHRGIFLTQMTTGWHCDDIQYIKIRTHRCFAHMYPKFTGTPTHTCSKTHIHTA